MRDLILQLSKSSIYSTKPIIGGMAESVRAGEGQRNRWIYSDSSSACVAVISELKDGTVNVMTRSCENYCGVSAVGSLDGKYVLK